MRRLLASRRASSTLALATWERAAQSPHILNLGIGQPALSLLPGALVLETAADLSGFDARHLLQYGSVSGSAHYTAAVASYLAEELGEPCDPGSLFATPGNSGGLALVTRALTTPGDLVLMEEPSYFLAHQIFRDYACTLLPAPQRASGAGTLDIDALDGALRGAAAEGQPTPALLYCVPTGNNPTGNTMPDADRVRLVGLCAEHGVRIVADDVYELLQWRMADAPKPLRWHARQQGVSASVISLGSWSKLLGPGLRLGWVEADEAVLSALAADGEVNSGSFTSPLVECLVSHMITRGAVKAHVDALRAALARRAALLADAINRELPDRAPPIVHAAPAGYFLWVDLRGVDASELRDRCAASHGVTFLPGARCALDAAVAPSHARVCFAFLEEDDLVEAGRRLGRAIAQAWEVPARQ